MDTSQTVAHAVANVTVGQVGHGIVYLLLLYGAYLAVSAVVGLICLAVVARKMKRFSR